jgi:hypothetical protein
MDADKSFLLSAVIREISLLRDINVIILSRYGNRDNLIPVYRRILSRRCRSRLNRLLNLNMAEARSVYKIFIQSFW